MRTQKIIGTRDIQSGLCRAYIVQPKTVTVKPGRKYRERVRKIIRRRKVAGFFRAVIRGLYIASWLYAVAVVVGLINAGTWTGAELARLIISTLWIATPLAIRGTEILK